MICNNCKRDKGDVVICPYCHVGNIQEAKPHHLPKGTVLGGRYTIIGVLGEGGFGITYLGSNKLGVNVAIKEYYPHGFTYRVSAAGNKVSVTESDRDEYEHGKARFLTEAKTLVKFNDEPGIVNVTDYIDENNTAYIIMEYLNGTDLRDYLIKNGKMSVNKAIDMLMPVMNALVKVHKAGMIHRDISPDNIMRLKSGGIKLMDFGSAKVFNGDVRSMSVMLKPGFAPEEQYRRNGKQGPWTDVYGLCATIYCCITGKVPDESLDRLSDDRLKPPSKLGVNISPAMEKALMYGLAVRSADRCQSVTELLNLIDSARNNPYTGGQGASTKDPYKTLDADKQSVSKIWDGTPTEDAEKRSPADRKQGSAPKDYKKPDWSTPPEQIKQEKTKPKKKEYYPGTLMRVIAGVVLALHIALIVYNTAIKPVAENDLAATLIIMFAVLIFLLYANYRININYLKPLALWVRIGVYILAGIYAIEAVPVGVNIAKNIYSKSIEASSNSSTAPTGTLSPDAAHDNAVFIAMVDYLEQKLDLSDYTSNEMENQGYISYDKDGNYEECSASWNIKSKDDFSAPSNSIQLEGGATVIPDETTVSQLILKGYTLANESPISLDAGKRESIHLFYNYKSAGAWVENKKSSKHSLNSCVITSVYIDPSDGVGFSYQGLNNSSNMDDILSVLRKPNRIFMYSNEDYNEMIFDYSYSDGTALSFYFDYVYSTKSTKLRQISFS